MTSPLPVPREPILTTLARNGIIALILGALLAMHVGGVARWPAAAIVMLWPTLGGHWIELWFLRGLRPRLSGSRRLQATVRIAVWFVVGVGLIRAMAWTAKGLGLRPAVWLSWWVAGLGFIGVELAAHVALQIRGKPSFYNGRG